LDTFSSPPFLNYLADELHLSPHYLCDMLRALTGQNAQQHIHNKAIEKAKAALSTTTLSIAEKCSPMESRQSFN